MGGGRIRGRAVEWNSAIQQIGNLRYAAAVAQYVPKPAYGARTRHPCPTLGITLSRFGYGPSGGMHEGAQRPPRMIPAKKNL